MILHKFSGGNKVLLPNYGRKVHKVLLDDWGTLLSIIWSLNLLIKFALQILNSTLVLYLNEDKSLENIYENFYLIFFWYKKYLFNPYDLGLQILDQMNSTLVLIKTT